MIDLEAEITGRDFLRFYVNLNCLLKLMARERAVVAGRPEETGAANGRPYFCESSFEGPTVRLRIECRRRGIRPFVALMDAPWPGRVFLGRLAVDGAPRVFGYGLKILYDRLKSQGGLEAFNASLEQALDFGLGRRPVLQ